MKGIKIALLVQELLKKVFFYIRQSGEASLWRVFYQWGLPRLVFQTFDLNEMPITELMTTKDKYRSLIFSLDGVGPVDNSPPPTCSYTL